MVKKFLASSLGGVFWAGLMLSLLLVLYVYRGKHEELLNDASVELTSTHQLIKTTASDVLAQQEVMLKVLGRRLSDVGGFANPEEARRVMDSLLKDNPAFVAYGLASPEGELRVVSENLQGKELPNLKESPRSSYTFEKALESQSLVVGSTYFFEFLGRWISPVRFALRDDRGQVQMVITTAFDIDGEYNPWRGKNLQPGLEVSVTTEPDSAGNYYPIYYYPYQTIGDTRQEVYGRPLPKAFVEKVNQSAKNSSGLTVSELVEDNRLITMVNDSPGMSPDLPPALIVVSFDQRYRYFLAVRQPLDGMKESMQFYALAYIGVAASFNLLAFVLLFRLFRSESQYQAGLRRQALRDHLTQLPNRYDLTSRFGDWVEQHESGFALMYLDLDNFKFVNDQFGHSIGDQVLIEIAKRIARKCEDVAWVVRQGGDEFIVMYPASEERAVAVFAEQVLHAIQEVMYIDGIKVAISASIGIAMTFPGNSLEGLDKNMVKADLAMYEAKKRRNHFAFYSDSMQQRIEQRALIERELKTAVLDDELYMVYQPQVSADDGAVVGFEALLRWHNTSLGEVPPDQFIPVAEASGLINAIGDFVVESVLRDFLELDMCKSNCTVSINVSVHQLVYGGFREFLLEKTRDLGINPEQLMIEITESLFIEDFKQTDTLLKLLRSDGFGIALDDFGTGYSSLSVLRELPINEVKVDKSFVRDILDDANDRMLIKSIIGIGKSLKIPVLAEGVESEEQVEVLKEFGCDRLQGYFYQRPLRLDDLRTYLQSR
jgi:diguanylate cyclase (GGDEF)-like protein